MFKNVASQKLTVFALILAFANTEGCFDRPVATETPIQCLTLNPKLDCPVLYGLRLAVKGNQPNTTSLSARQCTQPPSLHVSSGRCCRFFSGHGCSQFFSLSDCPDSARPVFHGGREILAMLCGKRPTLAAFPITPCSQSRVWVGRLARASFTVYRRHVGLELSRVSGADLGATECGMFLPFASIADVVKRSASSLRDGDSNCLCSASFSQRCNSLENAKSKRGSSVVIPRQLQVWICMRSLVQPVAMLPESLLDIGGMSDVDGLGDIVTNYVKASNHV